MINALGPLEMDDMVTATDAADVMLKTANMHLLSHEVLDPGRLMLVVEGDLTTCRAALDADSVAVAHTDRVVNRKKIDRPDNDTQWLIGGFKRQPKRPEQKPEAKTEVKPEKTQDAPVTSESSAQLPTLLASVCQGMTAGEVVAYFGWSLDEARNALGQLLSDRTLRKCSSRYRLKN